MPKGVATEGKKIGRPAKPKEETEIKQVRIWASVFEDVKKEADRRGQSLTIFVTRTLQKALEEMKKEQNLKD